MAAVAIRHGAHSDALAVALDRGCGFARARCGGLFVVLAFSDLREDTRLFTRSAKTSECYIKRLVFLYFYSRHRPSISLVAKAGDYTGTGDGCNRIAHGSLSREPCPPKQSLELRSPIQSLLTRSPECQMLMEMDGNRETPAGPRLPRCLRTSWCRLSICVWKCIRSVSCME